MPQLHAVTVRTTLLYVPARPEFGLCLAHRTSAIGAPPAGVGSSSTSAASLADATAAALALGNWHPKASRAVKLNAANAVRSRIPDDGGIMGERVVARALKRF